MPLVGRSRPEAELADSGADDIAEVPVSDDEAVYEWEERVAPKQCIPRPLEQQRYRGVVQWDEVGQPVERGTLQECGLSSLINGHLELTYSDAASGQSLYVTSPPPLRRGELSPQALWRDVFVAPGMRLPHHWHGPLGPVQSASR